MCPLKGQHFNNCQTGRDNYPAYRFVTSISDLPCLPVTDVTSGVHLRSVRVLHKHEKFWFCLRSILFMVEQMRPHQLNI